MFNIEVMDRNKCVELYAGTAESFTTINLMNGIDRARKKGCYSDLINFMEDAHWENAELLGKSERVCFFQFGFDSNFGVAISGTRVTGYEHWEQHRRISKALREVLEKDYNKFNDTKKQLLDMLLKDYQEYGCDFPSNPIFQTIARYDDGTTKELPLSDELKSCGFTKSDFTYDFDHSATIEEAMSSLFKNHYKKEPFPKGDGPDFKENDFVIDTEGRRGRCMGYDPNTNKYQVLFIDAENISADGWYSSEQLSPYTLENEKKPEKVSNIDDLISRATAISEQSKGLADDLSKFRDGFDMTD